MKPVNPPQCTVCDFDPAASCAHTHTHTHTHTAAESSSAAGLTVGNAFSGKVCVTVRMCVFLGLCVHVFCMPKGVICKSLFEYLCLVNMRTHVMY